MIPGKIDRVWTTFRVDPHGTDGFDWYVEGLGPGGNKQAGGFARSRWKARRHVRKYVRQFVRDLATAPASRADGEK